MVDSFPSAPVYFCTLEDASGLPQSSKRRQAVAIVTGICAESALLGYAAGHLLLAMVLGLTSSAALSWTFTTSKADDRMTVTGLGVRSLIAFAILVATAMFFGSHRFHGSAGSLAEQRSAQPGNQGNTRTQPGSENPGKTFSTPQDAYSGIVLWPKKQTLTKLIAPSPMSWDQKLTGLRRSNPLFIPFNGVYWLFRTPQTRPPANSRQAQGSPEMYEIHSTDWRPLSMEAHQNLGDLVDLSCCSRIEVAIRNADRYPPSVSLELVLVDNSSPGKPSESLGRGIVDSPRRSKTYEERPPASETLTFAIPRNGVLKRFDEAVVVFRLDGYRARTGAQIGIDHFTLIPQGL